MIQCNCQQNIEKIWLNDSYRVYQTYVKDWDKNIYFNENWLEIVNIKGIKTKVFHGYLTYIPNHCPKCGCINEAFDDIIKWNWKRNCKIKVTKACAYNTLLML